MGKPSLRLFLGKAAQLLIEQVCVTSPNNAMRVCNPFRSTIERETDDIYVSADRSTIEDRIERAIWELSLTVVTSNSPSVSKHHNCHSKSGKRAAENVLDWDNGGRSEISSHKRT